MNANPLSGDVRSIIREVLAEILASRKSASPSPTVQSVRIADDNELAKFVARLILELDDPATAAQLRSGSRRFTLQRGGDFPKPEVEGPSPSVPTLQGVITESKLDRLAAGGVVVLGAGAILTPLARDKACKLGLKIERVRSC